MSPLASAGVSKSGALRNFTAPLALSIENSAASSPVSEKPTVPTVSGSLAVAV